MGHGSHHDPLSERGNHILFDKKDHGLDRIILTHRYNTFNNTFGHPQAKTILEAIRI